MKKEIVLCSLLLLSFNLLMAQYIISGTIKSRTGEGSTDGISITVKGAVSGTVTDANGNFQIVVPALPATLVITSINFERAEVVLRSKEAGVIALEPAVKMGQEIIIGTNRFPTTLIAGPVSIERYGFSHIRDAPGTSYYDLAAFKKGVDVTTSSLTFKTPSTRGFNSSGSTRVNQLVDGMDNQAPGLNFFVGSFAGLTELDVDHVEILPGASSALYGPGGMNGTILINSKNPFQHQGLSLLVKGGANHVDRRQRSDVSPYQDMSLRWARAFNRFAFKLSAQYTSATDWLAGDSSNYRRTGSGGRLTSGNRMTDPNYDGVNVYGDETTLDVRNVKLGGQTIDLWKMVAAGMKPYVPAIVRRGIDSVVALSPSKLNISRTGYPEKDIIDPRAKNVKLSGALHYRLTDQIEAQLMGYWSNGNTVYTANNRFVLKDIMIGQYKLELKHKDWFLRGYTTQEDAGDAHSATVTTQYVNEAWKPSGTWYQDYTQSYLLPAATSWATVYGKALAEGQTEAQAAASANATVTSAATAFHNGARSMADQGRPLPGSEPFRHLFDSVRTRPISKGGGLFLEKSQLWVAEGQYAFSPIKWADILIGGNWKKYVLNSEGTLFIDRPGEPIMFHELGGYAQVSKKWLEDKLTLSFSGRYDKNESFKGRFTPRATALIQLAPDNNLRLSYQTAYRFPSTQQKYIYLDVGDYTLLGGLPWIQDSMHMKLSPVLDISTLQPYTFRAMKPENCRSFEVGYKAVIHKRLLIDAYAYLGQYQDFLGRTTLYQPGTGRIFSVVTNSAAKVKTHGFGLGMDYLLPGNFSLFLNGYSDVITGVPPNFQAYFNTPKYRVNAGFANSGLGKKRAFGCNVMLHWQDAFMWEGELANGPVKAYATVDAQVSYKIPKWRSMIKLGGTNIFNNYYKSGYANPEIGGLYYISVGFNL
jgi:outer membrane receptor protein involved in Fe transport